MTAKPVTSDQLRSFVKDWKHSTDVSDLWDYMAGRINAPEPVDPYAELKAAHARGEVIEFDGIDGWLAMTSLHWSHPPERYRIRPWTLASHVEKHFGPLPDGAKFHREDFTREMLPDVDGKPTRPLLDGEVYQIGDEWRVRKKWDISDEASLISASPASADHCPSRTTRPLPVAPRVVPYTLETLPKLPFEVRDKSDHSRTCVYGANGKEVLLPGGSVLYRSLFNMFTHPDGSECGTTEGGK